jgi:predicted helicase
MEEYQEFNNICFVDTLDHTSFLGKQMDLFAMSLENTERIKRQNDKKISVIIGNPPYNANQQNENDNNKNREYPAIDNRIKATYVKESTAQKTKVYDMYSRFFRWATDRLGDNGIIVFITNSSFINAKSFDGFRKTVANEFDYIYILDLGGDIRSGDKTGNVFNIMIGVAITFMIKTTSKNQLPCQIMYLNLQDCNSGKEKLDFLGKAKFDSLNFQHINPDQYHNWINLANSNDFETLLPLVNKETKLAKNKENEKAIFKLFSLGVVTSRDEWVYDFNGDILAQKIDLFINIFTAEQQRWNQSKKNLKINDFIERIIKWTSELEQYLIKGVKLEFNQDLIGNSLYRPFVKKFIYYDKIIVHRLYQMLQIFPTSETENKVIIYSFGTRGNFAVFSTNKVFNLDIFLPDATQSLPLYRYDPNGNRQENITNWGLEQFREYYQEKAPLSKGGWGDQITKEDIFYYVYAVLHNPNYRKKYELNLKREFPRIPFYNDFYQWVNWGKKLMDLHLNYETVKPYELKRIEVTLTPNPSPTGEGKRGVKPKLKADKMKGKIMIDDVTTLTEIPPLAWEYQLGNKSALEWILDQYKEKKPKDPTIAEQFNNYHFADYKESVINLLMRVITVSIETMNIIKEMEGK